jgi:hypothetical protein
MQHTIRAIYDRLHLGITYNLERLGVDTRSERGFSAIEMAVIVAAMVGVAVIVGAIIADRARTNAESIPSTVAPPQ